MLQTAPKMERTSEVSPLNTLSSIAWGKSASTSWGTHQCLSVTALSQATSFSHKIGSVLMVIPFRDIYSLGEKRQLETWHLTISSFIYKKKQDDMQMVHLSVWTGESAVRAQKPILVRLRVMLWICAQSIWIHPYDLTVSSFVQIFCLKKLHKSSLLFSKINILKCTHKIFFLYWLFPADLYCLIIFVCMFFP